VDAKHRPQWVWRTATLLAGLGLVGHD
jgi:hypothetical protein